MNTTPTEYQECVTLTQYLELLKDLQKIVLFSHIDQAKHIKSFATMARRRQEGVRRGVPDYIIVTKSRTIFIEMKRAKAGVVSEDQKHWIESLNNAGCYAFIAKGFDEAKLQLDRLLIDKA